MRDLMDRWGLQLALVFLLLVSLYIGALCCLARAPHWEMSADPPLTHQVYLPLIMKPPEIRVFDADGNERDLPWAQEKYNVAIETADCAGLPCWKLVELRERIGPSSLTVSLAGPLAGVPVAFYWPDAPEPSLPGEPRPRKLVQLTNSEGQTGFGMGAYYRPWLGECGPYATWISNYPGERSDLVGCLGMVAGTFHAHLEPTFERK